MEAQASFGPRAQGRWVVEGPGEEEGQERAQCPGLHLEEGLSKVRSSKVRQNPDLDVTASPKSPSTGPGLPLSATLRWGRESQVGSGRPELSYHLNIPRSVLPRTPEEHPGPELSESY